MLIILCLVYSTQLTYVFPGLHHCIHMLTLGGTKEKLIYSKECKVLQNKIKIVNKKKQ